MKMTLNVVGMHCHSCEFLVEDALEELGVKAKASHEKGTVNVDFDKEKVDVNEIRAAIEREGYKVV